MFLKNCVNLVENALDGLYDMGYEWGVMEGCVEDAQPGEVGIVNCAAGEKETPDQNHDRGRE